MGSSLFVPRGIYRLLRPSFSDEICCIGGAGPLGLPPCFGAAFLFDRIGDGPERRAKARRQPKGPAPRGGLHRFAAPRI